ncbi:MAG: TlpA family protein disulfide reductase [Acidimicrobiia bacterium]|nr:TlpA family protein disulfide reductase [Acidimicrobiia bacterium]
MNRRTAPSYVLALTLVATACGGGDSEPSTTVAGTTNDTTTSAAPIGDPAPTNTFTTFAGESVSLATYQGKPVVLNFWASWCPSCVAEMSAAFKPVEEDLGDDITFLGMNIQDDRALAEALLEETGVDWVSAQDPDGDLYVELGGIAMPFTVYITAGGRVVEKHNGPLTESQLREQIAEVFR